MKTQPKHSAKKPIKLKRNILALVLSLSMIACLAFGGPSSTVSWMRTEATNQTVTFTKSTAVAPTVTQAKEISKAPMVPGTKITFKATVTVPKGVNFNYYLFAKVAKSGSLDNYLDYTYAGAGWTVHSTSASVDILVRTGTPTNNGTAVCDIFTNNELTVEENNTNNDKNAAPSIAITAALVQKDNRSPAEAYSIVTSNSLL